MNEDNRILGCYVSITHPYPNSPQQLKDLAEEQGRLFRTYIWGDKGISNTLKTLNHKDYGQDLLLALFQFYVNPIPYELEHLKEIESYRKKEKAIGIPIIVNEENFFSQSEEGRYYFLKQAIFNKLDLLAEVVKKKKLDTNIELLKSDLQKIFM
jgi:hypothetical protein